MKVCYEAFQLHLVTYVRNVVTEKPPEVKTLKFEIMGQLMSGKTLTVQPKVGHRI